jgi:hypothetical protein
VTASTDKTPLSREQFMDLFEDGESEDLWLAYSAEAGRIAELERALRTADDAILYVLTWDTSHEKSLDAHALRLLREANVEALAVLSDSGEQK